jgi:glycosyltransferase involved in cell wall biosynthesis
MSPSISIILPVYNGAFTLDRALRSVLAQEFADWEIVAVDDGSSDDTWPILERWSAAEKRLRIIRLAEDRGIAAARNAAIEAAQGEMLAFLDRDDEYHRDYLAGGAAAELDGAGEWRVGERAVAGPAGVRGSGAALRRRAVGCRNGEAAGIGIHPSWARPASKGGKRVKSVQTTEYQSR